MSDSPVVRRTIIKFEVPSRLLPEGKRDIRVYLPPGYQEVLSYPVVYCQDGEDFFNFGRIATHAQRLILDEDWEPFIVVGVDVDKKLRTSEYAPDGQRHFLYTRFFTEELLPFVEAQVAVRRTVEDRLLAGDSLGGTVSLSIALQRPDLFTRILSLSGAFYASSQAQATEKTDLSWLSIWMVVGLQETAYETDTGIYNFVELNRKMSALLEQKGATISYSEKPGEHKWGFWQNEIPGGLREFVGPDGWL
ncbi:alpha/beta hydrolase [Cohnella faecalis]|uniref:Esterase family protein n=1 Tax=Cohnella faecalis TaxID=2315694 RepID=A0A398CQM4_9BACL|nr:alpha/beta hydrolase-fold protein [Cohnella faecalis]RIE04792.1 esterase family protein [Cohnella faecalis]